LVLAAYNAGPAPVYRAIRLAGSRNFWVLERYLPKETRQHVRRFLATEYYFAISEPVIDPVGPVRSVDPVVDPVHSVDRLHSVDPIVDPANSVDLVGDPLVDPVHSVDAQLEILGDAAGWGGSVDPGPGQAVDAGMLPKGGLTDKYFYYRL
jgi:hypothetical protein